MTTWYSKPADPLLLHDVIHFSNFVTNAFASIDTITTATTRTAETVKPEPTTSQIGVHSSVDETASMYNNRYDELTPEFLGLLIPEGGTHKYKPLRNNQQSTGTGFCTKIVFNIVLK